MKEMKKKIVEFPCRPINIRNTDDSLSFRLNSNDPDGEPVYVQMVTALVFQLIQCVVQLPAEKDEEDDHKKKVTTNSLTNIITIFK